MQKARRAGLAVVIAILIASTLGLGTRVYAAGGSGGSTSGICRLLKAAEAFVSHLPSRDLADYLMKLITEQEGLHGC